MHKMQCQPVKEGSNPAMRLIWQRVSGTGCSRGMAERWAGAGTTKNSNCSCAPFFNVTSGSGLVVTESGGACILSDSAVPWCVVNLTTCASPRAVHRNRGEPWDYCARPCLNGTCNAQTAVSNGRRGPPACLQGFLCREHSELGLLGQRRRAPCMAAGTSRAELPRRPCGGRHPPACIENNCLACWHPEARAPEAHAHVRAGTDVAGKRALIYSYAAKALPAPAGQGVPLAPILGSVIPAAVLAVLAALAAAWWWQRKKEKRKLSTAPASRGRLPQDSDAILTPNSSGPFPVNMENVEEYMVKPADFQILRRKDGTDWLLGQGAFGKARPALQPLPHLSCVTRSSWCSLAKKMEERGARRSCSRSPQIVYIRWAW